MICTATSHSLSRVRRKLTLPSARPKTLTNKQILSHVSGFVLSDSTAFAFPLPFHVLRQVLLIPCLSSLLPSLTLLFPSSCAASPMSRRVSLCLAVSPSAGRCLRDSTTPCLRSNLAFCLLASRISFRRFSPRIPPPALSLPHSACIS